MIEDPRDIKALAIDFDGVIVDSQSLHLKAWNDVLRQYKINRTVSLEEITGLSVLDFVRSLGLPIETVAEVAKAKKEYVVKLGTVSPPPLYPKVVSTLKLLVKHYRLAIVSSCEAELVKLLQRYYDIHNIFEVSVLEDDYHKAKPDPEPYQVCLQKLNLPAKYVVAIEDSPAGVKSAHRAGLSVVAVTNTTDNKRLHEADIIINKFHELLDLFVHYQRNGG